MLPAPSQLFLNITSGGAGAGMRGGCPGRCIRAREAGAMAGLGACLSNGAQGRVLCKGGVH